MRENYLRDKLNIKITNDRALEKLRKAQRGPMCISNINNYDILSNPLYQDWFSFATLDRRTVETISSDICTNILYCFEEGNLKVDDVVAKIRTRQKFKNLVKAITGIHGRNMMR